MEKEHQWYESDFTHDIKQWAGLRKYHNSDNPFTDDIGVGMLCGECFSDYSAIQSDIPDHDYYHTGYCGGNHAAFRCSHCGRMAKK